VAFGGKPEAGTVLVKDINPGPSASTVSLWPLTRLR